jgi:hypothetical protein
MDRSSSLLASGLLLVVIIISTGVAATLATPARGNPTPSTLVPLTTSAPNNTTELIIRLYYSNGTEITSGKMFAGTIESNATNSEYMFKDILPGIYQLNITGVPEVYMPSASVKVVTGINLLNVTVYQERTFYIVETANLSFNNTEPGPSINVKNGTAVTFIIYNNTTLIQNVAVVNSLYNTNYSSVLFNSLSNTITAGGSVNDTFIVTQAGNFYYECLIGNDAKAGEYGFFVVTP